jgi:hypothetical protein
VNGAAVRPRTLGALATPAPSVRRIPRYRSVEWSLGFAAVSGLLLWEIVPLPWHLAAPVLVAHVLGAALVLAAVIVPFWVGHRGRLRNSQQARMRLTGRVIEVALLLIAVSGLYLFLVGNRGEPIGRAAHEIHLWLTFPLAAGVAVHLARGRLRARRPRSRTERPVA